MNQSRHTAEGFSLKLWIEYLYRQVFERRPQVVRTGSGDFATASGLECMSTTLCNIELGTQSSLKVYVPSDDRGPEISDTFNLYESKLAALSGTLLTETNGVLTSVRLRSKVTSNLSAVASGPTGMMEINGVRALVGLALPGPLVAEDARLLLPKPGAQSDGPHVYAFPTDEGTTVHVRLHLETETQTEHLFSAAVQSDERRLTLTQLTLVSKEELPSPHIEAPVALDYRGCHQPGAIYPASGRTASHSSQNVRWVCGGSKVGVIFQAQPSGADPCSVDSTSEPMSLQQRLAQSLTDPHEASLLSTQSAERTQVPAGTSSSGSQPHLLSGRAETRDRDSTVAIPRRELRHLLGTRDKPTSTAGDE
jgi:hypothetical protein